MKSTYKLPPAPEVVTARPVDMPFAEYRLRRKVSNFLIRRRLRDGFRLQDLKVETDD